MAAATTFHLNPKPYLPTSTSTPISHFSSVFLQHTRHQLPLISSRLPFAFTFCSNNQTQFHPQPEDTEENATTNDNDDGTSLEESPASILASLHSYKQALLAENNDSKLSEIEAYLKSIQQDKLALEAQVATLSDELLNARHQLLRISVEFQTFRKTTEDQRVSLVANAQAEVFESLLLVLDNFERAKVAIKAETEKEERINDSYHGILKQFVEILASLGAVPAETTGHPLGNPKTGSKISRVLDDVLKKLSRFMKT